MLRLPAPSAQSGRRITSAPAVVFESVGRPPHPRLLQAMPVLEGCISSAIGFLPMAFSEFEYVQKYFFTIFMLILVFGAALLEIRVDRHQPPRV